MQKGDDDNQQQQSLTSEYSTETLLFNCAPASSSGGPSYNDIAKVLSEVELPSPSPSHARLETSHDSGGTKKVDDDDATEGNVDGENEIQNAHENLPESRRQTRGTRQRRRSLIHERIRILKALVPNCNKRDQASILDDAISHIKSLQMQVQMIQSMGAYTVPQGLYMSPGMHQGPYLNSISPYDFMMNGMGYNMGHYGPYFNSISPIFPPFGGGFYRPMPVGTGSPRLLPNPHLRCPSQTSEHHVSSTTLSSDTVIATGSQVGSGISSQSTHHMP